MRLPVACVLFTISVLPLIAQTWTQLSVPGPGLRGQAAMAYFPPTGETILFGGANSSGTNETWAWNGSIWTQRFPTTKPSPRSFSANNPLVYDSSHQQLVLFGGSTSTGLLAETWAWDGTNWTNKTPASPTASPSPRSSYSMAYDVARGHVILYGGLVFDGFQFGAVNDTWAWDGSAWTKITTNSPTSMYDTAMAYDPTYSQIVLFGGYPSGTETWVWNGSTWAQKFSANSPSQRAGHLMIYDQALGQVVLEGGVWQTPTEVTDETYTWDGANWTLQPSPTAPGNTVNGPVMAYDAQRQQVVVYDTVNTWVWGGPTTATCNPPHSIFSDDSGTGGFAVSTVSNTQLNQGSLQSNLRVQNYVRMWLGITAIPSSPSNPQIAPNLGAGVEGVAASLNLIPACRSGFSISPPFVSCMTPGASSWTTSFCSPGLEELDLSLTGRSAIVSFADILIGSFLGTQPTTVVVSISDQLYSSVPAFKTAADCIVAPGGLTVPQNISCVSASLLTIARNSQQRQTMLNILASNGINITLSALINVLFAGTATVVQAFGDIVVLDAQTAPLGHLGVEVVKINGQ